MNRTIELLAPAGDMERLKMAIAYGADAVYLAGTTFGMRAYAGNFAHDQLYEAVKLAKANDVRVHVTINTMPRNNEIKELPAWLETLDDAGVTAVIVADMGAFRMAQKYAPHVEKHISTQASISNYATANAWYDLGAQRVILARECSMNEIREIRANTPKDLQIEAFVHGAMCVSYSGRCLLSNYMTNDSNRDSSRGACAQPCRYSYALMEEKRPNEYFPIVEDEKGSYILSSRDMCMIDHVEELIDAGLDSLKVEGRAKSAYYAALVTGAYRHAIDAALAGQPIDPVWRDEVEKVSHRHYSTGFYYGNPGQYYATSRYIREWQINGIVQSCEPDGTAIVSLRNKFKAGDKMELVGPNVAPIEFIAPMMETMDGKTLEEPKNPQMLFKVKLPCAAPALSILRHEVIK